MLGRRIEGQQRLDRRQEIVGDGAADAAVGEFDDGEPSGPQALDAAAAQHVAVDADVAELVDDERQPPTLRRFQHVADQRRLARPEEAGDDGDRNFGEVFSEA